MPSRSSSSFSSASSDTASSAFGDNAASPTFDKDGTIINSSSGDVSSAASPLVAPDDSVLFPRERIHRYLDRCVPPDMIAHQRATDGAVLVRLCEAVVEFGMPMDWAERLPADMFYGCEATNPNEGHQDGCTGPFPCDWDQLLYSSEYRPANWEREISHISATTHSGEGTSPLVSGAVPWEAFTHNLTDLVDRLRRLLNRSSTHFPSYVLPFRLQARVAPVLYGWVTHWPLVAASLTCWRAVLGCFHAVCGAHAPQLASASKPLVGAAAAAAVDVADVQSLKDRKDAAEVAADAAASVSATFTLPWKPLAALYRAVVSEENTKVPAWLLALSHVAAELPALCRRVSPFFDPSAVDGLWSFLASDLSNTDSGVMALTILVRLLPYRHLCVARPCKAGEEEMKEGCADLPQLTSRGRQLLHFLLVEAVTWLPTTRSREVAARISDNARDGGRYASSSIVLPWDTAVIVFVGSLCKAHPSVQGMDAYGEPLFTRWLRALALPVGNVVGLTGATAAAASSRLVRNVSKSPAGRNTGSTWKNGWSARLYARLLFAFPDNTDSVLWRHLERWIHATKVLVRPGMPMARGSPAERVCSSYAELARVALQRAPRSSRSSSASSAKVPGRHWSAPTSDTLVQLLLPLAVSAFQTRAAASVDFLVTLLRLSHAIVLPAVLRCVEMGLQSPTEVATQRRLSTNLLRESLLVLFGGGELHGTAEGLHASRHAAIDTLQSSIALLLTLISPSAPETVLPVLSLFAVALAYIPEGTLLPTSFEAEKFTVELAPRCVALFTKLGALTIGKLRTADAHIHTILAALPPSAQDIFTRTALTEARNRDHGALLCPLVKSVASQCPVAVWACVQSLWLPLLKDPTSRDAEVNWAAPLLTNAIAGLGDRALLVEAAPTLFGVIRGLLRFLTSKSRLDAAMELLRALVAALMRPRYAPARSAFDESRGRSPAMPSPRAVQRLGTVTQAKVAVDWPTEDSPRLAMEFFNNAITDVVELMDRVREARRCSPALTAAAAADIPLCQRFLESPTQDTDAPPGSSSTADQDNSGTNKSCASESASPVDANSVLDGAVKWMLGLLEVYEWVYLEPSVPALQAEKDGGEGVAGRRGLWWRELDPRTAWHAVSVPAYCRPCYSRTELFEHVLRYVCLPMLQSHFIAPLCKAGVSPALLPDLSKHFRWPASPEIAALLTHAEESVADFDSTVALLWWFVRSSALTAHCWNDRAASSFQIWKGLLSRVPGGDRRWRMPLRGWACHSVHRQLEASLIGYLPVPQQTLSDVVLVFQCMTASPHVRARRHAVKLLTEGQLAKFLDGASLKVFNQRQLALGEVVLRRWQELLPSERNAEGHQEEKGDAAEKSEDARPAPAQDATATSSPTSAAVQHTLRESLEGTQLLLLGLIMGGTFARTAWAEARVLRFMIEVPAALRTVPVKQALDDLFDSTYSVDYAASMTCRSSAYIADLVQCASCCASAYPTGAVVSLSLAQRHCWPSGNNLVPILTVRQLVRLCTASHAAVQRHALELLSCLAKTVATPVETVPVRLTHAPADAGIGSTDHLSAFTFLLSPEALRELDPAAMQAHTSLLTAMQESVRRLSEVCPLLPQYLRLRGLIFPPATAMVPKVAAEAAGLVPRFFSDDDGLVQPHAFFRPSPSAIIDEARRQWRTVLLGSAEGCMTPDAWAMRMLRQTQQRQRDGGVARLASPSCLLDVLASLNEIGMQGLVIALLEWAETQLRGGVPQRTPPAEETASTAATEPSNAAVPAVQNEEQLQGFFVSLTQLAGAAIRMTAPVSVVTSPEATTLRRRALDFLLSLLRYVCGHAAVPNTVAQHTIFLSAAFVHRYVSSAEVLKVIAAVGSALGESTGEGRAAKPAGAEGENSAKSSGSRDAWSQQHFRFLLVLQTFAVLPRPAVLAPVLPPVVSLITSHSPVFFASPADQVRQRSAGLLSHLSSVALLQSEVMEGFSFCGPAVTSLLQTFLQAADERAFHGAIALSTPAAQEKRENGEDAGTAATLASQASVSVLTPEDVALLTTLALYLDRLPLNGVLAPFMADVLQVLCRMLDLSFTQAQLLHDAAETALGAMAEQTYNKEQTHLLLDLLYRVCTGAAGYGTSRRAQSACTRVLRVLIFTNLHRIGKYATMVRVGDAALVALSSRHAEVRSEGERLFAVLTKVASEAQTRVLVQTLTVELRQLPRSSAATTSAATHSTGASILSATPASANGEGGESSPSSRPAAESASSPAPLTRAGTRRMAVVQALAAAVLADPGVPSPYVPKLLEVLGGCAREGNTECGRFAKRVFELWWQAHREGWTPVYRAFFTPEQVANMSDLLSAPPYFA